MKGKKCEIIEKNLFYKVNEEDEVIEIASKGYRCINTEDEEKNLLG
jgi:hypothetical protein